MKFLLIQLRRIGDVLMTTPSIRMLHECYPDAEMTFLTESPSDQVLNENPNIQEILLIRITANLPSETLWRKVNVLVFDTPPAGGRGRGRARARAGAGGIPKTTDS